MKDKLKLLGKEWTWKTLGKVVEEAIVDCHDESEVFMGIVYMLKDGLVFPFKAEVIGEIVDVVDIDDDKSNEKNGIIVII